MHRRARAAVNQYEVVVIPGCKTTAKRDLEPYWLRFSTFIDLFSMRLKSACTARLVHLDQWPIPGLFGNGGEPAGDFGLVPRDFEVEYTFHILSERHLWWTSCSSGLSICFELAVMKSPTRLRRTHDSSHYSLL